MVLRHKRPVIGILSDSINKLDRIKPQGIQAELAYLTMVGHEVKGSVCVFSPRDINWSSKEITGYRFRMDRDGYGQWEASKYPLPTVVYDQMFRTRSNKIYHQASQRLKEITGGRYFNSRFYNKMMVYNTLVKIPELTDYLPLTKRLKGPDELASIMERYDTAYVKPVAGSMGHGIIKITRTNGYYRFKTRNGRKDQASSIAELYEKIKAVLKNQKYLIQKGIYLFTYNGNVVDIRVLIQKNKRGEWSTTKLFARVAKPGQITSNLASGGTAYPVSDILLQKYSSEETVGIKEQIKTLALKACQVLEETSGENFGELGVDIGLDNKGRLWLIELNSKPRRTTTGSGNPRLIELSFTKPLAYASFLAGSRPANNM
jgi:glutathione synthase/RimK-type ligase-like ATP-grasp enzyme